MVKNNGTPILVVYFAVVCINLIGHGFEISSFEAFSKPLLIPILITFVLIQTKDVKNSIKWLLIGALFFSWIGDVALLFDKEYPILFMVGLGGFFIAHLQYIILFSRSASKIEWNKKGVPIIIFLLILYTSYLLYVLWPFLNDLKIPVFAYSIVLMLMGISAVIAYRQYGRAWIIFGAILFIVSDSILAINKFYEPVTFGRVLIMFTYTAAQFSIVFGMMKYFKHNGN